MANVEFKWSGSSDASEFLRRNEERLAELDRARKNRIPETEEQRQSRYASLSNERPPSKGCRCINLSPREAAILRDEQLDNRESTFAEKVDEWAMAKLYSDLQGQARK